MSAITELKLGLHQSVLKSKPRWFDEIEWDKITNHKLKDEDLECLKYMSLVEGNVPNYLLIALLSHETRRDPAITDFLSTWAFQELWHAIALHAFRDCYAGRGAGESTRHAETQEVRDQINGIRKYGWIATAITAIFRPAWFMAIYATRGGMNELMTQQGYTILSQKAQHPILSQLLKNLIAEEANHAGFYLNLAQQKLDYSKFTQRVVRYFLGSASAIVGEGFRPSEEADRVISYLFASNEGREIAPFIDACIARLPGLEGMTPLQGRVQKALVRVQS